MTRIDAKNLRETNRIYWGSFVKILCKNEKNFLIKEKGTLISGHLRMNKSMQTSSQSLSSFELCERILTPGDGKIYPSKRKIKK